MEELTGTPVESGNQTPGTVTESTVQSSEEQETVNVSLTELLGAKEGKESADKTGEPAKGKPVAGGTPQPNGNPKPAERTFTQSELNKIISDRLEQERRKGAYVLGTAAITARAKRDGVSEDEAFTRIQKEETERRAETYAKDPKQLYIDMQNGTFNPYGQQPPAPQTPAGQPPAGRYTTEQVATTLEQLETAGDLPEGFTGESVTKEFVLDAMQNGTEMALYHWLKNSKPGAARNAVADELERRRSLPRPMQTSGGNVASRPASIREMSKEDFAKLDAQVAKGGRAGMPVRIEE